MRYCHTGLLSLTLSLSAFTLTGCGGGAIYDGPQRSALTGTVTVDGTPLVAGTIGFVSSDGSGRSTSAPIADGTYSIPEGQGPTYGKYQVVISGSTDSEATLESEEESPAGEDAGVDGSEESDDDEGDDEEEEEDGEEGGLSDFVSTGNTLPAKYNSETELSAEVDSPSHTFDFDLTTN